MASTKWPPTSTAKQLAKRARRLDGPAKAKGEAKYAYDISRPQMLYGKILSCPHAHARIRSIDVSAAQGMPGVRAVNIIKQQGSETFWEGAEIACLAADTEDQAIDAIRAIKVEYEVLPHVVADDNLERVPATNRNVTDGKPGAPQEQSTGDVAKAFGEAHKIVEGRYGLGIVTHCCLEAHGQVVEWSAPDKVMYWPSTQAVSPFSSQVAQTFSIPAANVGVSCQYMGGGFGSKFAVDLWGLEAGKLAKQAGRPVKMMLDRNQELQIAGMRPTAYGNVKIGCDKDGIVTAWESTVWGTGGITGGPNPPLPYVFVKVPNVKRTLHRVMTNTGPSRAWRAPNHPQAAMMTMTALSDLAAAMEMDELDFFLKNLHLADPGGTQLGKPRVEVYREELLKAAEMIDYRRKAHKRGANAGAGPVKRGLGISIHTWQGRGHASNCQCDVHPDGTVEIKIGTQDLGTGNRTVLAIVAAETFGLNIADISVKIGENSYPSSGGSGGSTTVGGVSSSTRRACTAALNKLFEIVAPSLNAAPDQLEAVDGRVRVIGTPQRSLSWKEATTKIGTNPITITADRDKPGETTALFDGGAGGVQICEVSVDTETGIVRIEEFASVQDCGLIVSMMTCESQVMGAIIMGICSALYEEKVQDEITGRTLNANMEFYKLAGIGDIGSIKCHMMTGPGYDERGPIGVGEPPANSPMAAVSNAIANATGIRVPIAPFTPDRVLVALDKGGRV